MKKYTSVDDIPDVSTFVWEVLRAKKKPLQHKKAGKGKTLGLFFFNPSLRTRLSTQRAATNLGMHVISMDFNDNTWRLEFDDGAVMNGNKSEHVKEAAGVISKYCDILAIRTFPNLKDRDKDAEETVLNAFVTNATIPVISMESATEHPLQALADAVTIEAHKNKKNPKVVLSWAPHPKALPQAVPNSFVKIVKRMKDVNFLVTHPEGYELDPAITQNVPVEYDQQQAFKNADFVYVKNWSSYRHYGKILPQQKNWIVNTEKMALTHKAKLMHCLPVRRNIVLTDELIDSADSLILQQAENRIYATQFILKKILDHVRKK